MFAGAMIATNKSKQIVGDDLMGMNDLSIHSSNNNNSNNNNNATAEGENNRTSPRPMPTSISEKNGTKSDIDGSSEAFRTNDEILLGT